MAKLNEKFVVGSKNIPAWLKIQSIKGRVKFAYDEDMNVVGGTIYSPTGTTVVGIGDTIVLTNSGLSVLPRKEKTYVKKEKNEYKGIQ